GEDFRRDQRRLPLRPPHGRRGRTPPRLHPGKRAVGGKSRRVIGSGCGGLLLCRCHLVPLLRLPEISICKRAPRSPLLLWACGIRPIHSVRTPRERTRSATRVFGLRWFTTCGTNLTRSPLFSGTAPCAPSGASRHLPRVAREDPGRAGGNDGPLTGSL